MAHLIIIGSGIAGLANAVIAMERGWRVTVFERHSRPLGASVRNFGALWPIGQPLGPARNQALRSLSRWKSLSKEASFTCENRGSLHLAYSDEAWLVLQEFVDLLQDSEMAPACISPEHVHRLAPHVVQKGLRGALHSTTEHAVVPGEAIQALVAWLQSCGVTFHFNTPVVQVHDEEIITSSGVHHSFDQLLICSGDETRLLFPKELMAAGPRRVKLQMLQTLPQPTSWTLDPIVVADSTTAYYEVFKACPSHPKLAHRIYNEHPLFQQHGIHVMTVQHPDGSLSVGDSHAYGPDFAPHHEAEIEHLIMTYLRTFLNLPTPKISRRWNGYYLKPPAGHTELILSPRPNITLFTALGGGGMTRAFGIAEERWNNEYRTRNVEFRRE